jgi:hypothetical protein
MSESCAFFGNDYGICSPKDIENKIATAIRTLITKENVSLFYVGQKGSFELDAYKTVLKLQQTEFPDIKIILVVADMHEIHNNTLPFDDFIYPEEAEFCHKRWCIVKRNSWIMQHCNFIICYNEYQGRAFKLCHYAQNHGVKIIDLS